MKVYFLGSLINDKTLDEIAIKSKVKPSNAPVNFENMLIKGLDEAGVETTVVSLPTVSTFPGGNMLMWGRRKETLSFGKKISWIPCLNLMGAKQLCTSLHTFFELSVWLLQNKKYKDKVIMNYSVYPPYSKPTQFLGKLFKTKTCCIISDLPAYLYNMHEAKGLKVKLNKRMTEKMVKIQSGFDSYILLTEHMAKNMKIEDKPSILVEGFSDSSIFDQIGNISKNSKKTVMYAGALSKSFNIDKLIDGFMMTVGDYELWLFGFGDLIGYIESCSKKDNRIKYFGKVEKKILLEHQKAAHLLISVKSPEEDHANYSFPSKILEYMTSGTAVASTIVGGIPKEYFDYIYSIKECDSEGIRDAIEYLFRQKNTNELDTKGCKALRYVLKEKNYADQGKKVADFLKKI